MPNLFRSGSDTTITGSIFRGPFTIAVETSSIKGPTVANTGFYNGITPVSKGYCVYAVKSVQGPSIRTAYTNAALTTIATQYGATGADTASINGVYSWFSNNNYVVANIDYPNVVTSGSVFHVDPGYIPSFPQFTPCYDLSKNKNIVTMPIFGADYTASLGGGSWGWGGTPANNQNLTSPSISSSLSSNGITLSSWVYFTSFDNNIQRFVTLNSEIAVLRKQGLNPHFYVTTDRGLQASFTSSYTFTTGSWVNVVGTYQAPGTSSIYINGTLSVTSTTSISGSLLTGSTQTLVTSDDSTEVIQGNISTTQIWNRALTAAEVLQNYNALLGKINTPSYAIGDLALGGIVFYILQPGDPGYETNQQHGLVAALENVNIGGVSGYVWGCYGTLLSGTSFTFIGAGAANTTAILAGCATRPIAASVANSYTGSGYTDWYLPSKDELNAMWNNVGTGASFPNYNKANLSGYLWSSSQVDSTSAWMQLMDNGTQFQDSKAQVTQNKIRPVRSF